MHHSLIHAVHTRHPSASSVARLAQRWVAAHMLSDMIPQEAIELIVAKLYTESSMNDNSKWQTVDTSPATVTAGFLKFLQLLHSHDWARYDYMLSILYSRFLFCQIISHSLFCSS